jgi:N-methylhydantoinase B
METTGPALGNTAGDGVRHSAYGVLGGRDGLPHRYRMIARVKTRVLKTKEVGVPIPPGAMFLVESMGGGGYGPPAKRSAEARAADRVNGFVSGRSRPGKA